MGSKAKGAGRPTVMTEKTLAALKEAMTWGCSNIACCAYADISKTAFYNYLEENPDFKEYLDTLRETPEFKARRVINKALDEDDILTAHKVIDRKEGSKVKVNADVTSSDGSMTPTFIFNPVGSDD